MIYPECLIHPKEVCHSWVDIKCCCETLRCSRAKFYAYLTFSGPLVWIKLFGHPQQEGGIFEILCCLRNPLKPTLTLSGPACTSLQCTSLRKATKQLLCYWNISSCRRVWLSSWSVLTTRFNWLCFPLMCSLIRERDGNHQKYISNWRKCWETQLRKGWDLRIRCEIVI